MWACILELTFQSNTHINIFSRTHLTPTKDEHRLATKKISIFEITKTFSYFFWTQCNKLEIKNKRETK